MMYNLVTVVLYQRQDAESGRVPLGIAENDRIRNEQIRGAALSLRGKGRDDEMLVDDVAAWQEEKKNRKSIIFV